MKKYVYELYNLLGTVEYVGETINPKERFRYHTKLKPKIGSGWGKFYGRLDIQMNVVKDFNNKKDAYEYQCQLQKYYGLITDSELVSKGKKGKHGVNKGKTFSIEHRLKMSQSKIGNQNAKHKSNPSTISY
jgi:hypothetical protein